MSTLSPPVRAPRRRLTREQRRRQILRKAAPLFAEKGLLATRVRDIAEACGVTEALLYRHFCSKDDLFDAALDERIRSHDIEGFLARLPEDLPLQELLEKIASKILSIGFSDPTIHRLLLTASLAGSEHAPGAYVQWRIPFVERLEERIQRGVASGELLPVDPTLTARAFVGLVMDCVLSCQLWSELGYPVPEAEVLVANNVPTFARGLRRHPGE